MLFLGARYPLVALDAILELRQVRFKGEDVLFRPLGELLEPLDAILVQALFKDRSDAKYQFEVVELTVAGAFFRGFPGPRFWLCWSVYLEQRQLSSEAREFDAQAQDLAVLFVDD